MPEEIEYRLRRSDGARHPRVIVSQEGGVEIVLPRGMAVRHAGPLLAEKRRWIERTLRRFEEARAAAPTRLEDGGVVPYLGEQLSLGVRVEPGRVRPQVALSRDSLKVAVVEPGANALRDALESWYRREARREIGTRLDAATRRAGRAYGRLSIRAQQTRWASCSPSGEMSFNWRLLLGPAPVLDYIVEHEVAHLDVPDHSPRFWDLLAERCPEYREHERWLRRNGASMRL